MEIIAIIVGLFGALCILAVLPFILLAIGISELISFLPYVVATLIVFLGIAIIIYSMGYGTKYLLDKLPPKALKWLGLTSKSLWMIFIAVPLCLAIAIFLLSVIISPIIFLISTAENPILITLCLLAFIAGCGYFARKEYQNS